LIVVGGLLSREIFVPSMTIRSHVAVKFFERNYYTLRN